MSAENGNGNGSPIFWRAVGIASAIAGGAAAGLGGSIMRAEPPPVAGTSAALEARVRANAEAIAGLQAGLAALSQHVDALSAERERRFQTLEARVDQIFDHVRDLQMDRSPLQPGRR